jgi:hypothetical protein
LKVKKKSSARLRKMRFVLLVGVVCVVSGTAMVLFAALWSPGVPPVDILMDKSGVRAVGGIYYDEVMIQNHSEQSVMAVVVIKTPLDASQRESAPVKICGRCSVIVQIEEVQPQPDANMDYYISAVENPDYVRAEYPPNLLTNFAASAIPVGMGAIAVGIILLIYNRTREA